MISTFPTWFVTYPKWDIKYFRMECIVYYRCYDLETISHWFCCNVCIFPGICATFLNEIVWIAHKISLPIRASGHYNVLARKPFFQKFTCRGKRASNYVGPWISAQLSFKCIMEGFWLAASVWFQYIMLVSVLVFIICTVLVTIADHRCLQGVVTLVGQNQANREMERFH